MSAEVFQPNFETLVIASSSSNRRDYVGRKIKQVLAKAKEMVAGKHDSANLAQALHKLAQKEKVGIAAFSPDKDAGVEESTSADTERVAIDKVEVLLIALGLISAEAVIQTNPWLKEKIIKPLTLSEELTATPEEIAIYASDVGTFVEMDEKENILGTEDSRELLKINRQYCYPDGTHKVSSEIIGIIIREYHDAVQRYTKGNFWVLNRVGFAMWHQGRMISEEWEIKLKYKPLPKTIVQAAFLKPEEGNPFRGKAATSAPRVELVELMKDYATDMWIRQTSTDKSKFQSDQQNEWLAVDPSQLATQELVSLFVLGGTMPTMSLIEFMIGNHLSPEQMLTYIQQEPSEKEQVSS